MKSYNNTHLVSNQSKHYGNIFFKILKFNPGPTVAAKTPDPTFDCLGAPLLLSLCPVTGKSVGVS